MGHQVHFVRGLQNRHGARPDPAGEGARVGRPDGHRMRHAHRVLQIHKPPARTGGRHGEVVHAAIVTLLNDPIREGVTQVFPVVIVAPRSGRPHAVARPGLQHHRRAQRRAGIRPPRSPFS